MRTRLSICRKKKRYASEADAIAAAQTASIDLRPYSCDRCHRYHLTSRTRGKRRLPVADWDDSAPRRACHKHEINMP
ncbi:hypothetical protein [Parasphingorhabdus flavimaris]|uniref:hypothetical protein n=1 Tax=Parasphingorhabdus flavimaris TaxID=266812 RepID=UPI00300280E5